MPGSQHGPSIKNPRVYEALRRKGMSKQRAARISNAQRHKDSGVAGLAIPPHGPNALFNQPGIQPSRRRRRKLKATPKWNARAGETIIGGLSRGEGGRFSSSGQPSARSTNSAARRERADVRREARLARAAAMKAAQAEAKAAEEETRAEEDAYIAAGATGRERQKRRAEIAAARRERAVARKAANAEAVAKEKATRAEEDAAEEQARATEDAAPKAAGGGGGGGKKKPSEDEKKAEADRKKAEQRAKTAPQAGLSTAEAEFLAGAASGTLPPGSFDAKRLMQLGLVQDTGDTTEATDAGRRAIAALERGDVRGALAAIQDGKARVARERKRDDDKKQREAKRAADKKKREEDKRTRQSPAPPNRPPIGYDPRRNPTTPPAAATPDPAVARERNQTLAAQIIRNLSERRQRRRRKESYGGTPRGDLRDSVFAGPDRSFPIVSAQDVRNAVQSLGRTKHDKAAVKRGIIRRARAIGAMDALPDAWKTEKAFTEANWSIAHREIARWEAHVMGWVPSQGFTVFKDASGRDRWAAITTTAYEDKDQEWISCKAIRSVAEAGPHGPLRFWHVPGLDLGDCDYQAALDDGRLLLESGTFRSAAAAAIGAEAARRGYQMSPGFVHSRKEPHGGVFDHIAIFERSFVPPGRASNPYTRLLTKEMRMLTDEKRKEFEALAGDEAGRALLQQLLAQASATTKAADAAGAVYKSTDASAVYLMADGTPGIIQDGRFVTLKAAMPPDEMIEAGETELADGEAELDVPIPGAEDEGVAEELMDDEGFADLIVQKLLAALGPQLELEKKMQGYVGEIKAALQPMAQKDDARAKELAALKEANTALDQRLKSLEGEQPRNMNASAWHQLTGIAVTKEQAAAITAKQAAGGDVPAGLTEQEQGAYALIFGE